VKRVLAAAGYEVHVAASGGDALLLCEEVGAKIDLILTDVVMPGMSGRRLIERLASLCPNAKTTFMSGYTDERIEHHGVLGPHLLRKPFDVQTLAQRVRKVLDEADPHVDSGGEREGGGARSPPAVFDLSKWHLARAPRGLTRPPRLLGRHRPPHRATKSADALNAQVRGRVSRRRRPEHSAAEGRAPRPRWAAGTDGARAPASTPTTPLLRV
jgi:CheY-like chemotaxis protein